MNTRIRIALPATVDVASIKHFASQFFGAVMEMHNTRGTVSDVCILPIGHAHSFSVYVSGTDADVTDDHNDPRVRRFAEAFARRFNGVVAGGAL